MKRIWKNIILIGFAMALCVLATGCMGGQKDITKADREKYTAVVAEACEEYGYTFEEEVVLPKGAELVYVLSDGDETMHIEVIIDEESTSDRVSCDFDLSRGGAEKDNHGAAFEPHLDVLVKIAQYFTDDITKDKLMAFLNNDEIWGEPQNEEQLTYKAQDKMEYCVYVADEVQFEGEEEVYECLEEYFHFSWDNGKTYKLKKDK